MKVSGEQYLPVSSRVQDPTSMDRDLLHKKTRPANRKTRASKFSTRIGKSGASNGRRSRPETPLLRWKYNEKVKGEDAEKEIDGDVDEKSVSESCRKERKGKEVVMAVSARKLAAGLWRLQFPEVVSDERREVKKREDRLGFQPGLGHIGVPLVCHRKSRHKESEAEDLSDCHRKTRHKESEAEDLSDSPRSVSGPRNGYMSKLEPSFQFSNTAMEGATKWDPICSKTADDVRKFYGYMKPIEQQVSAVSLVSALESELEQARARIQELEAERNSSKRKIEHFLKKLSEERSEWRRREHEKVRAIIDDVKADMNRERKNRQRMEIVNTKLVNEMSEIKQSVKRYMRDYEKERKARELIEEVCEELAKEMGEDKAEIEALKRESMKFREEVEEERRMLQMAEVWREERVQMKLVDAKLALEEKHSLMRNIIENLETFLSSKNAIIDTNDMKEVEMLQKAASSINIQEITNFSYEPANPDDIFSVFEDVNFGENPNREIGPSLAYSSASHSSKIHTVSPEANGFNKGSIQRHSNAAYLMNHNGDMEEDASGWETVSQLEDDRDSTYTPNGSAPSVNKIRHRDSNVSESGTDYEESAGLETPRTEIGEVCLVRSRQMKKSSSSISRLWKSCPNNNNGEKFKIISVDGMNGQISNGRVSNESVQSLDRIEQWSSPETGNPHITRAMKGCIEWPISAQKNSLKARLLEARMESQKVQLRQVLKQKF